jgi:hypothetical protein
MAVKGPCHASCGKSPAFHRGGAGSIRGRSIWDLTVDKVTQA